MTAKQICMLSSFIFGLTYSANARLGESPGTVEGRYGKPEQNKYSDSEENLKNKMALDKADHLKWAKYHANGFSIKVEFDKGKSTRETFSKSDGIDEQDAQTILQANGKNWTPVESNDRNVIKSWNSDDAVATLRKATHSSSGKKSKSTEDTSPGNFLTITVRPKGF